MRYRRRSIPEEENHERWVISYADFITLLFAFFVVMYSISSVNEGKYKVVSESLQQVFRNTPKSMRPIEVGPYLAHGGNDPEQIIDLQLPRFARDEQPEVAESTEQGILEGGTDEINQIAGEIRADFPDLLAEELIQLGESESWLEIEINNSLLFESGEASPNPKAVALIRKLAQPLQDSDYPVNVEGFTDNLRIQTSNYPSNWELSAARASAIVRILIDAGMAPERLAAIGYGEHKPIASNNSAAGRSRNRRVVLIMTKPTDRFAVDEIGGTPDENPAVQPVRLQGGGLLFTADPDQPRPDIQ